MSLHIETHLEFILMLNQNFGLASTGRKGIIEEDKSHMSHYTFNSVAE